ncbi:hypothetical protein [Rhodococcus sp. NPDC049939]|uniref:hypothetical protein n=1 Tax=Rhodococcus sp. NPDC049939 TaxID=3155511 RepID=UPI0033CC024C
MDTIGNTIALRDKHIPLPTREDAYRQILLLGTTGAGKTTVVRQLLGTDPDRDRFPSTSTAKTTVSDTEIVLAPGEFRAVVTFFPRAEIVRHLEECAVRASISILNGAEPKSVREHLLDHEQQRFRFSYVLGRRTEEKESLSAAADPFDVFDNSEFDDAEDASTGFEADPRELPSIDLSETEAVISRALDTLRMLVTSNEAEIRRGLDSTDAESDRDVKDLLAEDLERRIRGDAEFARIIDSLLVEIDKRFLAVSVGEIDRGDDGWPRSWVWDSTDRKTFLQAVNRFSSNYAPLFGHLLSPLVDGIRVSGPFVPTWNEGKVPRLVLVDGQGLGHNPASAAELSTPVTEWINRVDVVLLVDNAAQPMQAGPAIAIRSILNSGNTEKLVFCFTHFDEVTGDNLATARDRADHVLASAHNLATTLCKDKSLAERSLRRRLDGATVFLSRIDKPLSVKNSDGRFSTQSFRKLYKLVEDAGERRELGPARPVYARTDMHRALVDAIGDFHTRWDAILGLKVSRSVAKEHWTRIKALNKRFAEGSAEEYDTLRPSAELREFIKEELYKRFELPRRWRGQRPEDDDTFTAIVDEFSQAVARRLDKPIRDRLSVAAQPEWQRAFELQGPGSTGMRAEHIAEDVFDSFVAVPTPGNEDFFNALESLIDDAAEIIGVTLEA